MSTISQLPSATGANPGDIIPATQGSTTRALTVGQINAGPMAAVSSALNAATSAQNAATGAAASAGVAQSAVQAAQAVSVLVATGSSQSSAAPITQSTVYINGGSSGTGISMVTTILNAHVVNVTSFSQLVYPPAGGTINGGATNAPVSISAGGSARVGSTDGVTWFAG